MKLKTALELLGHVGVDDEDCDDPGCKMCRECEHHEPCNCMIEYLARRAREDAYEVLIKHINNHHRAACSPTLGCQCDGVMEAIRALPTEPTS